MTFLKLLLASIVSGLVTYKVGVLVFGESDWPDPMMIVCFILCFIISYYVMEGLLELMGDDDTPSSSSGFFSDWGGGDGGDSGGSGSSD